MSAVGSKLYHRFIKGLKDYGLTEKDMKDYRYCGGEIGENRMEHFRYWKLLGFTLNELPEHVDHCVCGVHIVYNCFIAHKDNVRNRDTQPLEPLIVGSCCIKHFCELSRTCDICDKNHQNTKDNICKDCRKEKVRKSKACVKCDKPRGNKNSSGKNMCNICLQKFRESKCNSCGKTVYGGYRNCYKCNFN
tara:strand:- start:2082 stop:2651 length:570 start_codon:yes stop_codon:yes gene_type:complete